MHFNVIDIDLLKLVLKRYRRGVGVHYIVLEGLPSEDVRYFVHKLWTFRKATEPISAQTV